MSEKKTRAAPPPQRKANKPFPAIWNDFISLDFRSFWSSVPTGPARGYGAFFQSWKQRTRHRRDVRMFLLKLSGEGAPGRTIEMMKCLDFAPVQAVSLETTLEVTLWPNINLVFAPYLFLVCGL